MRYFLLTLVLVLASCTNKKCEETLGGAATFISTTVATRLECQKPELIREKVLDACGELGLCKREVQQELFKENKGDIANAVCPGLSKTVIGFLIGASIPMEWECKPEATVEMLSVMLEYACKNYIPY